MNRLKLVAETSPYWHYTLNCMMSSISSAGLGGVELWLASPTTAMWMPRSKTPPGGGSSKSC